MEDKIKWITHVDQVPTASEDSLRRSLVTSDGSGTKIKQAALDELIKRIGKETCNEPRNETVV